jgi:hypothetical protein
VKSIEEQCYEKVLEDREEEDEDGRWETKRSDEERRDEGTKLGD